ncbi:MAG: hypothetical protein Q8P36_01145 [bacterium]|nr:hypothetical protein [bacterium]
MGKLEKEARLIRRKGQIQQALLTALLVGGMIAIGAVPYKLIPTVGFTPKNRNRFSYYTKTVAGRLVTQGLAKWVKKDDRVYLQITEVGQRKLAFEGEKMKLKDLKRRWDKRWRMVVFDIPERRSNIRHRLRGVMKEVGFIRLQDSVWVYPYDCEEFMALLKAELRIGKDVLYAIVERIENDKTIRTHFKLPVE